ncbi:epithelial discoidin domain-containing receptor 1 isoform X2 [Diachasma alloeum]|uniref:epithelial discoidin domain-containing receptor 1 isoform X2 n=1 Tax=Diachasma alloeum TaxID=454923 RepID=UPI00073844E4|nr:epithelial discoidin domain-containing receptor 1 isoform X2 [Diachasma alloeum]
MMRITGVFLFLLGIVSITSGVDLSQCIAPLGMESGAIVDEDITASSSFESGNVGPRQARLRTENNGGAWCPKGEITSEPREWLEIDLHSVHMITGTNTQGRFGNGVGVEYAEGYLLEYWRPRLGKWVRYRDIKGNEIMKGNTNTYSETKHDLDPPLWASKIRFLPYSNHRRTVCMRVEIYGCYWHDGIVAYSMPQGDKRGNEWEFFDATYDGYWDGELRHGLGQLVDGKIGPDNFKMGYYDSARSRGWVAWRNDTRSNQPIEIKFEFDKIREFAAVHLYCNNQFSRDVQVFSQVEVSFSIGGTFFMGEPIIYNYMEDKIFETSRNITIKLHHRVGKFVKLQLYFSSKWIMLSEIIFDSDIAHGNFTAEEFLTTEGSLSSDVMPNGKPGGAQNEAPVFTAKQDDPTYMAVVIGVLTAVILLLAVAIFFIVTRHRQRKCFASPMAVKVPSHLGSTCATVEKGAALIPYTLEDDERYPTGNVPTLAHELDNRHVDIVKLDDYQEPYQALKYAPYYSYSTIIMEMKDMMLNNMASNAVNYTAVPEMNSTKIPLLNCESGVYTTHEIVSSSISSSGSDQESIFSKGSSRNSRLDDKKEVLTALKRRLEQSTVPLFSRHRLRMLSKLAEGAFGTIYVAEAEGIPDYGTSITTLGKRLVAVKFLLPEASEKEKLDFQRDVRILAALEDVNIARVLGVCCREEPYCVVMEYLEHGDLSQFLKTHITVEDAHPMPIGVKTLSFNCLIYMAAQIASGMRYLENLNFVHRDLATRNCLVGKAYHIKISDFGTDNELYASDYYKVSDGALLPIRWMAWECVFLRKYTTKSDVWAFAVTLWEILNLGRHVPYEHLTDEEVIDNLQQHHQDNTRCSTLTKNDHEIKLLFEYLPKPTTSSKDIYDLMLECWRRDENSRPTFREITLFLQRKNLGYAPTC